jgi:hypothetical protein
MRLAKVLMLLAALAPRSMVYVKGHSSAAKRVRESLELFTCYRSGADPKGAVAILQVDHILAKYGGRSWIVMLLMDDRNNVLWKEKAEEYPWPLPSPLPRLLKHMARSTSTCAECRASKIAKGARQPSTGSSPCSQLPHNASLAHDLQKEALPPDFRR